MRNSQAGFALILALLLATLVLIALTIAAPATLFHGQRDKEEELLFRGEQYKRGITLYHRRFGRPPSSIKELLWTNERAYLRRAYPDPMTKGGAWRLIRVNPAGQLVGSVNSPTSATSEKEEEQPARRFAGTRPGTPALSAGSSGPDDSTLPIVGVGSQSPKSSIRVLNGHARYQEWEFIVEPYASGGLALPGGRPGVRGRGGQQPRQPGQQQGHPQPKR